MARSATDVRSARAHSAAPSPVCCSAQLLCRTPSYYGSVSVASLPSPPSNSPWSSRFAERLWGVVGSPAPLGPPCPPTRAPGRSLYPALRALLVSDDARAVGCTGWRFWRAPLSLCFGCRALSPWTPRCGWYTPRPRTPSQSATTAHPGACPGAPCSGKREHTARMSWLTRRRVQGLLLPSSL